MRFCKVCQKDISNKRKDAIYCSRSCKGRDKEKNNKYYECNKEKILFDIKVKYKDKIEEYRIKNKYRIQEYAKIYNESYDFSLYNKNRRKDPLYKLKQNTRNLIKNAFLRKFTKKSKKTTEILGCDFNFFSIYISSLFTNEMTWENYGLLWEIDHIIPISLAKSEIQVIELNHYTNLRPLLKIENRKKGKKY